jgi:hypothetical protein
MPDKAKIIARYQSQLDWYERSRDAARQCFYAFQIFASEFPAEQIEMALA